MKVPKIYHIGIPKTGTTTIQHVLREDDRINLIFAKRYFNSNRYFNFPTYPYFEEGKINIVSDESIAKTSSARNSLITYLSRLKEVEEEAIIILTIREQIDFLKSRYKHAVTYDDVTCSFTDWIASKHQLCYIDLAMYSNLYRTINMFFPKTNIKVLLYEDLKNDFSLFMDSLYSIIDLVPPHFKEKVIKNQGGDAEMIYNQLVDNMKRLNSFEKTKVNQSDFLDWDWDQSYWRKLLKEIGKSNQNLVELEVIDQEKLKHYNYIF